jgi:hypothetical protein
VEREQSPVESPTAPVSMTVSVVACSMTVNFFGLTPALEIDAMPTTTASAASTPMIARLLRMSLTS